ncbi:SCP2 sterol-binding domain-containing protein [Pseudomonas sp. GD04045]|uniref:alkyl sulfatase C-terminal domain-containing protein n=1 Tax=Pseudomonas sp. GD04045 TaxID=2975426 RepID=UPI002449431D|nr:MULTISPECIES: alkyl sulfatase C-terminal domain-containing protein [unclassified Pseudomonas]MDG9925690.1 SCP2 sterol-binding domain-containing protein [Pseudomonas sp. GD04045]MDH0037193.1 SCP2 sterol-binding domain-containing protein [Pseudomonas sp. GD04019]
MRPPPRDQRRDSAPGEANRFSNRGYYGSLNHNVKATYVLHLGWFIGNPADALEQLGYQAESGPWRNFYLTGAQELRNGVQKLPTPDTASPDTVKAMDLDLFFDYLAMRLKGPEVADKHITLNLEFTDLNQKYVLEMVNGVLNHTEGLQSNQADATITLTRDTLNKIMLKQTTLKDAEGSGEIKVQGEQGKLEELMSYMDSFDFWFNIVTP